jgi:sulfatase modifying factor 1
MRVRLALVVALASASCDSSLPPQGQVVLHLDTDAPVRATDDFAAPVALFDRVLVEVFPPEGDTPCAGCVRELVVDAEKMRAARFSFGFLPARARDVGWRIRLRLFRSAGRATPRTESTIEVVGFLPAVAEEGITELTARFRAEDVGRPRGTLEAPIVFDRGAPSPSAEGTWEGARVVDCTGEPPPRAACMRGGAFFMGDPRVTTDDERSGGAKEHLVVLAPFFIDEHEVTIAEMRASGLVELDSRGRAIDPRDDFDGDLGGLCDYTTEPGTNEAIPVDCVSHQLATKYCEARGGSLPSEAQFEYVATWRGTRLAPWGNHDPSCDEAIVGRALATSAGGCNDTVPFDIGQRIVPERPGSSTRDRVFLGDVAIVDLGANVREWTRDAFAPDTHACWRDALLRDPVCVIEGAFERSAKGAGHRDLPVDYAPTRRPFTATNSSWHWPGLGFRCVYPGNR